MSTERIAYLCGEYPRATDTFIQREVAALRAAGIHVRTISIRRPPALERVRKPEATQENDTYYVLPAGPWRLANAHAKMLIRSPRRYIRALITAATVRSPGLRTLLYQLFYFAEAAIVADVMHREQLVHLHNHAPDASGYVAMIAAEMGGFSYSLTLHGHGILSEPGRWRLREKLERALFTVCVSWHARSQAMLWSPQSVWSRFHVVHCGVDSSVDVRREHRASGSRLLFVGRLDHLKGLPLIIDALERIRASHRDVQLDIVGDGPERAALEAIAKERGLTSCVRFHGYLDQDSIQALMKHADALLMASFSEGIPVTLMEAMAAGLPVVAPRITGIPELVHEGHSGLLFDPANVDQLTDCIVRLIDDPDLRTRLAQGGRAVVEQEFNLNIETRRLVQLMSGRLAGEGMPVRPPPSTSPA
ncbi:MAG: glycosyltransferase family 4 protein [Gammaproteobacteria bacterium]|nr:glycosyltransferase family 4 protein [Gammaproteobacteria bacterium]